MNQRWLSTYSSRFKLALVILLGVYQAAPAVTLYQPLNPAEFVRNPNQLRGSLSIPYKDTVELLKIPYDNMKIRVEKGTEDGEIEPLKLYVPNDPRRLRFMAESLANGKAVDVLEERFAAESKKSSLKDESKSKITISRADFTLMDPDKIATVLGKPHHNVTVDGFELYRDKPTRLTLMRQISAFFNQAQRNTLAAKLKRGEKISLEKDILPDFARSVIRTFPVFRGPNCFHASLSFHGSRFANSDFYNIKQEIGYNAAMINYDELWRTLSSNFYEVDPKKHQLEYGDIIIFMDIPTNLTENSMVDYRWIRHAATYLFGPFTFSKGSKSPSTPYSIKTITEEWQTWTAYATSLGVKVFRKSHKSISKTPPFDLTDWIY